MQPPSNDDRLIIQYKWHKHCALMMTHFVSVNIKTKNSLFQLIREVVKKTRIFYGQADHKGGAYLIFVIFFTQANGKRILRQNSVNCDSLA